MTFDGINYPSGGLIYPIHAHPNAFHTGTAYSQTLVNAYAKCREPRIIATFFPPFTAIGDMSKGIGGFFAGGRSLSSNGAINVGVNNQVLPGVTSTGSTNGSLWNGFIPYVPEHVSHIGAQVVVTTVSSTGGENRLSVEVTDGTDTDVNQQSFPFADGASGEGSVALFELQPLDILTELDTVALNRSLEWDIKVNPVSDDSTGATTRLIGAVVYTVSLG